MRKQSGRKKKPTRSSENARHKSRAWGGVCTPSLGIEFIVQPPHADPRWGSSSHKDFDLLDVGIEPKSEPSKSESMDDVMYS